MQEALLALHKEYYEYNSLTITREAWPDSIAFGNQVGSSIPCVYRLPAIHDWSSVQSWTQSDLANITKQPIEIACTPTGRADSLVCVDGQDVLMEPANVSMTMQEFLHQLDDPSYVVYLQSQNSNLLSTPLVKLINAHCIPDTVHMAEPVLGRPDAVNLWIGDARSVTSVHRDPYENIYIVLKGRKIFTLFAPVEEITLPTKFVRTGRWQFDSKTGAFEAHVSSNSETIPWITIDPLQDRAEIESSHPLYKHARPQKIIVDEGEMLYLPAGFYHHVQQEGGKWPDGRPCPCIAVNYWFDQSYTGEKYVMRQHLGRLVRSVQI